MIQQTNARTSNRRGAALIIALVLLLLVTAISASLIRGFYTDRQERDRSLIRVQAELLRQDFADRVNLGQVPALTLHAGPLDGTFQLTSQETGVVVEYFDNANNLVYSNSKSSTQSD